MAWHKNPNAGMANDMARGHFVALGVNQMTVAESEHGAVGEELVEIGIRVSGWLLGLVLGVDDGDG